MHEPIRRAMVSIAVREGAWEDAKRHGGSDGRIQGVNVAMKNDAVRVSVVLVGALPCIIA